MEHVLVQGVHAHSRGWTRLPFKGPFQPKLLFGTILSTGCVLGGMEHPGNPAEDEQVFSLERMHLRTQEITALVLD